MNSELTTWLEYSKLQLASEAFLDRSLSGPLSIVEALTKGNDHSSRFTPTEAAAFATRYEVAAHKPNTGTGFSGTLFWDKLEHKYTLSFRSTEFVEDVLADSVGTNEGIAEYGWAFGQIADMEDWWAGLQQSVPGLAGQQVTVTGYSLGGHLATAFAQLRAEAGELSRIQRIYTFNGAGTGGIKTGHTLTEVMALFRSVRDTGKLPAWLNNPTTVTKLMQTAQDRLDDILEEKADITGFVSGVNDGSQPLQPHEGDFGSLGLHFAMAVAGQWTTGAVQFTNLPMTWDTLQAVFDPNEAATGGMMFHGLMTELLGSGISAVATGGLRHTYDRTQIKIEDQPLVRGTPYRGTPINGVRLSDKYALNDFGDTHSLVLIIDSLAVMDTLARLDQNPARIDNAFATRLINAAGWHARNTDVGDQGNAEGNSLEILVDALHALFKGTDPELRKNPAILEGGRWADEPLRNAFYAALESITTSPLYQQSIGKLNLVSLAGMNAQSVATLAAQDSADGLAYRYALEQMSPFVLTGDAGIYAAHNADGHLNANQSGSLYWQDRAAMLSWVLNFNADNTSPNGDTFVRLVLGQSAPYYFEDEASNTKIRLSDGGAGLAESSIMERPLDDFRHIVFGSGNADVITGQSKTDHLYGAAGDDTLIGGESSDRLEGGAGTDTYQFTTGDGFDTVFDSDGQGVIQFGEVQAKGSANLDPENWSQLSDNVWSDSLNGITYTRSVVDGVSQLLIRNGDNVVVVRGWAEGQLGIALGAGTTPERTLITGDLSPLDTNASAAGVQLGFDTLGNVKVSATPAPGRVDILYDNTGDELIQGLAGNDILYATRGGNDRLEGGDGNDAVWGGIGDDVIDGGVGDDLIGGGSGTDQIHGGTGRDMIFSAHDLNLTGRLDQNSPAWTPPEGATVWTQGRVWGIYTTPDKPDTYTVSGGGSLSADSAPDFIFAGDGDDRVVAGLGSDYIDGGKDNDTLSGHGGDDVIDGGDGNDRVEGDGILKPDFYQTLDPTQHGNDSLFGGNGADSLIGGGKDDSLFGGTGADLIWGDDQDETLLPGQYHGNDMLDGGADNDQLVAGGGNDTLWGGEGNDLLWGDIDDAADLAGAYHGNDTLDGGIGNDQLVGGGASDTLTGGDGDDVLFGDARETSLLGAEFAGNDTLDGGLGNDTLDGGIGADVMQGGAGDDFYLVDDAGDQVIELAGEGNDTVRYTHNVALANATLAQATAIDTPPAYTLPDNIEFLILQGNGDFNASGNAGNNALTGNSGANQLGGGAGNDTLTGGAGNDAYVFNRGDGQDVIVNTDFLKDTANAALLAANDTLRLGDGIADTDVLAFRVGNSLLLKLKGSDEQVAINDYYAPDLIAGSVVSDHKIDQVVFASGVAWDQTMIQTVVDRASNNHAPTVSTFLPPLKATSDAAFSFTVPENTFTDSDPWDSIGYRVEMPDGSALPGWLSFDAATRTLSGTPDVANVGNLQFYLWGTDNYGASAGQMVTVQVKPQNHAPVLVTALPDKSALQGSTFSYTVASTAFTDPDAGDSLSYSVTLADGSALPSWLSFNATTRTFSGTPANTGTLSIKVTAKDQGNLTVSDVFDVVVNSNNHAPLLSTALPDRNAVQDSAFSYTVSSTAFTDPDAGDALSFTATLADGSALPAWLSFNTSTRTFTGTPASTGTLSIKVTAKDQGNLTVSDVFDVVVKAPNHAPVLSNALPDQTATQGSTFSYTIASNAFTDPDAGDTLSYTATLADGSALPAWLNFNASTRTFSGSPAYVGTISIRVMARDAGNMSIADEFNIVVSTPNLVLNGTEWDDHLYGGEGNDTLAGGPGYDTLAGNTGSDTYLFNLGDGVDHINEVRGNDYTDVLKFGVGINPADISVHAADSNLELRHVNGMDKVVINNWFEGTSGYNQLAQVIFANGVQWSNAQLNTVALTITGTEIDDTLTGQWNYGETFYGSGGSDTLSGEFGNDVLFGGDGNDKLNGGYDSDILDGGPGNDILDGAKTANGQWVFENGVTNVYRGGTGNDTLNGSQGTDIYEFNLGDGQDTITYKLNLSYGIPDRDTLRFGPGINPEDIVVSHVSTSLVFTHRNGQDKVTVQDWFRDISYQLLRVEFANGVFWTGDQLTAQYLAMAGTSGNDTMDGRYGTEAMSGGPGNDTYWVDEMGDIIVELENEGTDQVKSSITYTLGANVENLVLTGSGLIDGFGNALDNTLTGNSATNTLAGGAGNDTYIIGAGDSVAEQVNGGTDKIQVDFTYTLGANIENLTLTGKSSINGTGNELNNILTGNNGNNILDGLQGVDKMVGGAGNDTYFVDNTGDIVTEGSNAGTDSVQSSVTFTLANNIENLTLTGTSAINGTGNTLNNILTGNSADNTLNGGLGADKLIGGLGNDTYVVDDAGDIVNESASAGTDTIQSSITLTLAGNVENLTLTGTNAINASGNGLNNILIGNSGNNTLNGGSGADAMSGGAGNDIYQVDNISDSISESSNAGTDSVLSGVTFALSANVENLTLTGTGSVNATGNELNNSLTGNSGNNVLDGGLGADKLKGGLGNDTYLVDNVGDIVTEEADAGSDTVQSGFTYTLGINIENLTLMGTNAINGTGNELINILNGNSGDNTLNGGLGADKLIGGLGNDTYVVEDAGDSITEIANAGMDTVQSSISFTLANNVENLTLTGTSAINATGNSLNNILTGNSGNNTLNGGSGADTMAGGAGDDSYQVDNVGDTVTENANAGSDIVLSSVSFSLGSNIENLTLTGTNAVNATGNSLNNILSGNSGNNILDGGLGDDSLFGGLGKDTLNGGSGNDTYLFNRGDGVDAWVENDATPGNVDMARFGSDIAHEQIWFRKSGTDLEVTIIGTTDKTLVKNWYGGSAYHIERFEAGNGKALLDSQVDALVAAMAAFAPPTAGQTTLPSHYHDALAPVLAANWQ